MVNAALPLVLLAGSALASPLSQGKRQTCPSVHIFGARETTAPPGYGEAEQLIDNIISANSGATAEAINYPASGDNPPYAESRSEGVSAVNSQVQSFASQCPDTKIVLVGYSQGAEIFDLALCEGSSISSYNIVAAIFFGAPTFNAGASFDVGTCTAGGVSFMIVQTPRNDTDLIVHSSTRPWLELLAALSTAESNRTVTPPIRTAAVSLFAMVHPNKTSR